MILLSFLFILVCYGQAKMILKTKYEWKYVEYDWDTDDEKTAAINSGEYNSSASVLIDVNISFDNRIFVTICRTKGVPATLAEVTSKTGDGGPLVRPYPDWETNKINECTGLINVLHTDTDKCNRLWVLDSGMIDDEYKCPAKLMIIDMGTDEIVTTHEIPRDLYQKHLTTIVVNDDSINCNTSSAVLADTYGQALVIFSGEQFCRLEMPEFGPDPSATRYEIDGVSFAKEAGVLGMAIAERTDENLQQAPSLLYLKPLSSYYLYTMLLSQVLSYCDTSVKPDLLTHSERIETRSAALAIANQILFFGGIETNSLDCCNTAEILSEKTYVKLVEDPARLQWISGIKSYPKTIGWAQNLLILSNRYQKVITHTINKDEVNYRILLGNADELTSDTNCF